MIRPARGSRILLKIKATFQKPSYHSGISTSNRPYHNHSFTIPCASALQQEIPPSNPPDTMVGKRVRPPSVLNGTETVPGLKSSKAVAKSKAPAAKRARTSGPSLSSGSAAKNIPKAETLPKPDKPNRLQVGIDFGTTHSGKSSRYPNVEFRLTTIIGVSHVMAPGRLQSVDVVKDWVDGIYDDERLEKVPSRIAFSSENPGMDEDKWGYEVPVGSRSYTWFKLLLDASVEEVVPDSEELRTNMETGLLELPENMTAEQVVTAYLSKLYAHTIKALERRYTADIIKATPIDFWFTVPANWQEYAVDGTRTAANEAGFASRKRDRLAIITEPEAAAINILSYAVEENSNLLKVCGGGGLRNPYIPQLMWRRSIATYLSAILVAAPWISKSLQSRN